MASITQYVEQRLKLRVNREKSRVDRATRRTFLGFGFMVGDGKVKLRVDPKARSRAKHRLRTLTARTWSVPMKRRIDAINRFYGRVDGLLCVGRYPATVRGSRQVAAPPAAAGALEGMEGASGPPTQPHCARCLARHRPPMGRVQYRTVAHGGLPTSPALPDQRLLDQPRPAGIHRALPGAPGVFGGDSLPDFRFDAAVLDALGLALRRAQVAT